MYVWISACVVRESGAFAVPSRHAVVAVPGPERVCSQLAQHTKQQNRVPEAVVDHLACLVSST